MEALAVTARLGGPLFLPGGALALDGLLAAAVALRDRLPPPSPGNWLPVEIPVERAAGGRFHLASFAVPQWESRELRYLNRRFPLEQGQSLGNAKLRRINLTAGPTKSFRIPIETGHVRGDELRWWCVGDAEAIRALLALTPYVGKKRSVGYGRVLEWSVAPCEPWDAGFPVVREARALRPLPLDWPGLIDPEPTFGRLTYPYWDRSTVEPVTAC